MKKLKLSIRIILSLALLFVLNTIVYCQYSPAGGVTGSDAIIKSDNRFKEWVSSCTVIRGYIQISDPTITYTNNDKTSNYSFYGDPNEVIGAPKSGLNVVSLGDGGIATVTFVNPIKDGDGPDFAVFENGMTMPNPPYLYFLELAFVEVSTDGLKFVRFPSVSLTQTQTQIETFGQLDPTKINNLAGKYTANYGTPFDLHELIDSSSIDINNINYIRFIDVIGSIDPKYCSYDSKGNIINDPFPTPFWNSGFDLQAVGVINMGDNSTKIKNTHTNKLNIFPNPVKSGQPFTITDENTIDVYANIEIINMEGKKLLNTKILFNQPSVLPILAPGMYLLNIKTTERIYHDRLIIIQ